MFKSNVKLQEYLRVREVADVLQDFREVCKNIQLSDLLEKLSALMPRYYSISSSSVVVSELILHLSHSATS